MKKREISLGWLCWKGYLIPSIDKTRKQPWMKITDLRQHYNKACDGILCFVAVAVEELLCHGSLYFSQVDLRISVNSCAHIWMHKIVSDCNEVINPHCCPQNTYGRMKECMHTPRNYISTCSCSRFSDILCTLGFKNWKSFSSMKGKKSEAGGERGKCAFFPYLSTQPRFWQWLNQLLSGLSSVLYFQVPSIRNRGGVPSSVAVLSLRTF